MIFDLVRDFSDALDAMPAEHPRQRIVKLLDEAIRRDIHFIDRHPTTLFHCMWNMCWWYDCSGVPDQYDRHWGAEYQLGEDHGERSEMSLSTLFERWRRHKAKDTPGFRWLRSLRAPEFQLATGQRAVLLGHADQVSSVSYSPDGTFIVSGSYDKTVRVWDADSAAEWAVLRGHDKIVTSVACSPDGHRIASGSGDNTVRVWDAHSGLELTVLRGHESGVMSVSYSPDGSQIASVSLDKTVRVWDAVSGTELQCLGDRKGEFKSVVFSRDGVCVITGGDQVQAFSAKTGEPLLQLDIANGWIRSVAVSSDDRRIVGGGAYRTYVWDARTGAELLCVPKPNDGCITVYGVAISPDDRSIVCASERAVYVWETETGKALRCLTGHKKAISCVGFSPDGRRIVSGSRDCTVRVWDTEPRRRLPAVPQPSAW